MTKVRLSDIFMNPITGEWGESLSDDEIGSPVIRTTNFTNEGVINYDDIAMRSIDMAAKDNKLLQPGDIIIEKSGGTPTTPVGRVVYFDGEEKKYFVNNFTSILRTRDDFCSKYLLYLLLYFHKVGVVLKFQNKTTGIINLKLRDYLESTLINIPTHSVQEDVAFRLDLLKNLIAKRQEQIEALDDLVESVFYDLIFENTNEKVKLGNLLSEFIAGKSLAGTRPSEYRVLKTSCVYSGYFDEDEWKFLPEDYKPKDEHIIKNGDLLVSRMNTEELVGASAYVTKDYEDLTIPDRLWILRTNEQVSPIFLWKFF
ncbi:Type-1 restriction enzyme EcoKI specificity protein [Aedoeadaptatus nemausensis]|uniref:Type-1 restriction enzyme EcoKI specificity protein n=1 Tax=Aedoeadaptatus nemausensis TaxID=2582829 RepID=A0A6V6Y682_9FIRM|nr:restriction endonuclease subunit S [Peptoniphilus nemausensis]CAC9933838.1 Type-1 restriction enzyme EcoKI specificity protein [Peptoniphilus nemausensis]